MHQRLRCPDASKFCAGLLRQGAAPLLALALLGPGCLVPRPAQQQALPLAPKPGVPVEISPIFYTLAVEARGFGADVFLNDVLVESLDPAERAIWSSGVNLWVVPGENRLRVRSRGIEHPVGPPQVVQVRLNRQRPEAAPASELLADLQLVPQKPEVSFDETRTFRAEPAPPAQLWAKAEPLTLDEATRAAGSRLVRELERAFDRRDLDAATALLDWKTTDMARAGFREATLARDAQRETLDNLFQDPGYIVDHFTPEALQFELCAGGRLLRITRPTGAVLQVRLSQGGRFLLPVIAAKIGGEFRIVR
jgi:hypothetical protein